MPNSTIHCNKRSCDILIKEYFRGEQQRATGACRYYCNHERVDMNDLHILHIGPIGKVGKLRGNVVRAASSFQVWT